ncbi:MAG: response regulator, partial [Caldilinea sp.]|nr:response regulator [Caldilinea sp.]
APTSETRVLLREAIDDVLLLAQPLAHQQNVTLDIELPETLANLPVSQLALRTIVPTLLTMAIARAGRAPVVVSALHADRPNFLCIECNVSDPEQAPLSTKERDTINTMQEVASFYEAAIDFSKPSEHGFTMSLLLPVPAQLSVLVIDDNADWLELVERYASGSHYRIVATREPAAAPALADKLQPALILLDVMMQNVDGWQVLNELLQKPSTAHIPVILCTILPLEEMAISLGATGFLQKPVSQQQFLELLDRQSRLLA